MAREIYTAIEIGASAERVWRVLSDFADYPQWNPFIRRVRGQLAVGARLEVHIESPGGRGMTFRSVILCAEPNCQLRWRGSLPIPGLFEGEHAFAIEPQSGGGVRLVQREVFKGLLVPLVWRWMEASTRRGFEAMNRALKAEAEKLQER